MPITIYHDGSCSFCQDLIKNHALRQNFGQVILVDLRQLVDAQTRLKRDDCTPDGGLIVESDGCQLVGAETFQFLAKATISDKNIFNIWPKILANKPISRRLYPVIRRSRWLNFFLLNQPIFNHRDEIDDPRFTIFSLMFALFSVFHILNLIYEYDVPPLSFDQIGILMAAIAVITKPNSIRNLFLLALASTVSTILLFPMSSNHMITRAFLLLGFWLAFFSAFFRNKSPQEIFENLRLAGQGTLIGMYFFGVFHKINSGFLSPETSCAVQLWQEMPRPLSWIDFTLMHYIAIYGALFVETIILIFLLTKKFRNLGIILGISFHLLLSLSNYAMYISFTSLSITLHTLFITRETSARLLQSTELTALQAFLKAPLGSIAALVGLTGVVAFATRSEFSYASLCAMPVLLPVLFLVTKYSWTEKRPKVSSVTSSSIAIGALVTVLFFLNGFAPYMGLKTAQTINMFSNLRLEGHRSNHLLFSGSPFPFSYLNDVVSFQSERNSPLVADLIKENKGMVYYAFLDHMANTPDAVVDFTFNGNKYEKKSGEDLKVEMEETLHSTWVRKWFHFIPVDLETRVRC